MAQPIPGRRTAGADNWLAQLPAGHAIWGKTQGNVYVQNRKMVYMTDREMEILASLIARKLSEQTLSPEEVMRVRGILKFLNRTSVTAAATFIGFIVIGICALVGTGIVQWIKTRL